jgi:hypothetical protein
MSKSFRASFVSLIVLGFASACAPSSERPAPSASPEPPSTAALAPTNASPVTSKTFGAAITEGDATSLEAIALEPAKYTNKTVKTEGIVTAVCQHMGCWMEIGDQTKVAHIQMAGHSFFIPKDAAGHHAIVQGQLREAPSKPGACLHEGKDSCAPEADSVEKLQLEATGVELVD